MDASLKRGLWLMALAIFVLGGMDALAKLLIEDGVHTVTILAIRSVLIAATLLGSLAYKKEFQQLKTQRLGAHIARGAIGLTAVGGFFTSLQYLPLADATVVFFTGTLFVAVASVVVLKERFGPHRWLAIVAGYIGVVIAVNPGFQELSVGYAFALLGSLSYAGLFISGKIMSKTESTLSLVFYFNAGLGLVALALLPFYWQPISPSNALMIFGVAVLALIGHLAITQAFATREASLLAPVEYTSILWAILFDFVIWSHTPAIYTVTGGAIVIVSGLYFLHRERQNSRDLRTAETLKTQVSVEPKKA